MTLFKLRKQKINVGIYLGHSSLAYCIVEKGKNECVIQGEGIISFEKGKKLDVMQKFFQKQLSSNQLKKDIQINYSFSSLDVIRKKNRLQEIKKDQKKYFVDIQDELIIEKIDDDIYGIKKSFIHQCLFIQKKQQKVMHCFEPLVFTVKQLIPMETKKNILIFVDDKFVHLFFYVNHSVQFEYCIQIDNFKREIVKLKILLQDEDENVEKISILYLGLHHQAIISAFREIIDINNTSMRDARLVVAYHIATRKFNE